MANESVNTRLLAEILNDLDTLIEEQGKVNENSGNEKEINLKIEGNEDVVALLTGLGIFNSEKAAADTASQLKDIINILDKLQNMDAKKIDEVSVAVDRLMNSFSKLKVKDKDTSGLSNVSEFLVTTAGLSNTGIQNLTVIAAALTPEVASQISEFINKLDINKKTSENASSVLLSLGYVLNVLNHIDLAKIEAQLDIIKKLDGQTGKRLGEFMSSIDKSASKSDPKKTVQGMLNMQNIAKTILIMVGAIGILVLLTVLDMGAVLVATSTMLVVLGAIVGTVYLIAKQHKEMTAGLAGLLTIGKAVLMLVGAVGILALLTMLDMSAVMVATGLTIVLLAAVVGTVYILSKQEKELKAGLSGLLTIGKAVLMLVGAIGILTLLVAVDLRAVLVATSIALVLLLAVAGVASYLTGEKDKEMKAGVKGLKTLTMAVLVLVAAIGLMTLLVALDLKDTLIGMAIVVGIVLILAGITSFLSSDEKTKEMKGGINGLKMLTTALLMVVAAIGIMVLLINFVPVSEILIATGIVLGIVVVLSLMVKLIASTDEKQLHQAVNVITAITACILVISLIAMFLFVPIGQKWGEILPGALVVLGIIAVLGLMVWGLSLIKDKDLKQATTTLAVLTACVLVISLVALYLFIPIGQKWDEIIPGALVVLGIIAVMGLMVWGLSKIDNKDMKWGLITLASLTLIVLVISIVALNFFIPIGEQWDDIALGGTVVLGIIGILTGFVWALSKCSKKDLMYGMMAMGIMTGIVFALSVIALEYFIPIYDDAIAIMAGGGIILGLITIMGLIVIGLGKIDKKQLIQGGLTVAGIGGLLWLLSVIMEPFIDFCIKVNDNAAAIALGSVEILAILVTFGLIMAGVGALGSIIPYLAIGGIVLVGIAGVLLLISLCMEPFIDLSIKVYDNAKAIALGSVEILAILVTFGLIMAGVGALIVIIPFIAIGGVVLSGIAATLLLITACMNPYIDLAVKLKKAGDVKREGKKMIDILELFGDAMAKIGLMSLWPPTMAGLANGAYVMSKISSAMKEVSKALMSYLDVLAIQKKYTMGDIKNFNKFIVGKEGFCGSVTTIIAELEKVGIEAADKAVVISAMLQPIFKTITEFMNIIETFANMKYVSAWDKEGKPVEYSQLTPQMFKAAANAISSSFMIFLMSLSAALKTFDMKSISVINLIKDSIGPVMKSVGHFTDAIMSVLTTQIPYEWDKEGKPIKFKPFDSAEFGRAAEVITTNFASFLERMAPVLKNLPASAMNAIDLMKQGIEPVMNAVATYSDTIMSFVAGKEVEVTDSNGKTVKKLIEINPEKYSEAAERVGNAFQAFISKLSAKFIKYSYGGKTIMTKDGGWFGSDEYTETKRGNKVADLISGLSGIKDVVEGMGMLLDVIVKATTDYSKYDLEDAAKTASAPLITVMEQLSLKFGTQAQREQVETVNQSLGKLKTTAQTYQQIFNTMMKIYTDHNQKFDGMTQLITGFLNYFISDEINQTYAVLDKTIDETLKPLLGKLALVLDFFDTLEIDTESGNITINPRKAKKNTKILCGIIDDFAQSIKNYQEISTDINIQFLAKLATEIESTYATTSESFEKYYQSFTLIASKFK